MRSLQLLMIGIALGFVSQARAQVAASRDPNQVAAKVERSRIVLTPPDRYRVPVIVEPLRRVAVMAPDEGVLQMLSVPVGATVREGQEIARLDPKAAMARLRIASASIKEFQADYDEVRQGKPAHAVASAEARLEAAKARAELAQIEVDSHILRAPFSGRVTDIRVCTGQYLSKGATILGIDDVSSVRVMLPVDRTAVAVGSSVNFAIEGVPVSGRVQAVLPLVESQATLRELAAPLAAAWVVVANPTGALEPGQRAQSPYVPDAPLTGVPASAMRKAEDGKSIVQVIRAERVTDIPVKVLGTLGPDRTQVSGPFRPSDVLITSSSVPLRAGTFIRFNDQSARELEGVPPAADQVGEAADVGRPFIAPIGAGGRSPAATPRPAPENPGAGARPAVPF